jgi:hypothetical protein
VRLDRFVARGHAASIDAGDSVAPMDDDVARRWTEIKRRAQTELK